MENNVIEPTNTQPNPEPNTVEPPVSNEPKPKRFWHKLVPHKLGHWIKGHKLIAAAIGVVLLSGAGASAYVLINNKKAEPVTHFQAVEVPFSVSYTNPAQDATNATVHSEIKVAFTRPVDPEKFREVFFITPHVEGTFVAGDSNNEVIFKPDVHFAQGTYIQFGVSGSLESEDGERLGADFSSNFTTSIPSQGVLFERNYFLGTVDPIAAGASVTYNLWVGEDVGQATVTTYKSDESKLLDSLTYEQVEENGYSHSQPMNESINTAGLEKLSSKDNLKDKDTYDFSGEKGVYVLVATEGDKQLGHVWVIVSDYGVLLRQDDEQVVLSVQDFATQADASADVTLYNLEGGVRTLKEVSVTGTDTVELTINPKLDIAVARSNAGVAVVPVSVLNSMADARLTQDLSQTATLFGSTDKPAYRPGEKVQFAGFARTDNDANYQLPAGETYSLYVARYDGEEPKAEFEVTAGDGGMLTGSFTTNNGYLTEGSFKDTYQIFARSSDELGYDTSLASFTITNEADAPYRIDVQFEKAEYYPTDSIKANITATKTDGSPLSNTELDIKVLALTHYEDEATLNVFDDPGWDVKDTAGKVTLDGQGKANYTFDVSKLPAGNSQKLSLQVSRNEGENKTFAGAGSTIVHQGNAKLEFGPTRTSLHPGDTLVSRVYAKKLDNSVLDNATLGYKLKSNYYDPNSQEYLSKELATGSAKTDGNGYGEIRQALEGVDAESSVELEVWVSDEANNKVTGSAYYYIIKPDEFANYADLQLVGLDLYGSEKNVKVGDTVKLTVDAPTDIRALVTLERGRIYKVETIDLKQGQNSYEITIDDMLAPGFSIAFSYFRDGHYFSEGTAFNVAVGAKKGSLELKPSTTDVKANTAFDLQITTKDASGAAVPANVVLSIADENMYRLADPTKRDVFAAFYQPRIRTTNASSSLTGIGSGGGGRCGGHGGGWYEVVTLIGSSALWRPSLATNASGTNTQNIKLPKGTWRVYAYAVTDDTVVSNGALTLTVK